MRLIDADALKKQHIVGFSVSGSLFVKIIDEAPTVEPVKRGFFSWFERENGNPLDGCDYDWGWHHGGRLHQHRAQLHRI